MKLYVASSHKLGYAFTKQLESALQHMNFDIFFPENIGIQASTPSEMREVDAICCREIGDSDILIAIYPFGYSVSVEIGRFLALKDIQKEKERILIILDMSEKNSELFIKLRTEAMIIPHTAAVVSSISELLIELNKYIK